jgi:hypothetical protein
MDESKFKELKKSGVVAPKTTLKEFKSLRKSMGYAPSSRTKSKKGGTMNPGLKAYIAKKKKMKMKRGKK